LLICLLVVLLANSIVFAVSRLFCPRSLLEQYDFTGCKIAIDYANIYTRNYGQIAYLSEINSAKVLSLLKAADIKDEAIFENDYTVGNYHQYIFYLSNGEILKMTCTPFSIVIYQEYGVLSTLTINRNTYGSNTWLYGFDQPALEEIEHFTILYNAEIVKDFPMFSQLRIIDLATAVIIEPEACRNAATLEQVRLGKNLHTLCTGAFAGCTNLKEVYFQGNPETIEPGAFESGVTIYGPVGGTVEAYAKAEGLTFLPLPESIPPIT